MLRTADAQTLFILKISGNRSVARNTWAFFLTDATLSENPGGKSHEEQGHDGHLILEVAKHVDLSVGPASLPLAAIVGILLGGGGSARRRGGSAVGVVRGEGIHLVLWLLWWNSSVMFH